jgi:serine phosphatase RsbU (regulator of sigma subunit)/PAS domain-containing protein
VPSPLLLADPASGRAFFANRAAREAAGGTFPLDAPAPAHERLAAGAPFSGLRVELETPAGIRTLLVSGDAIVPPGHPPVGVIAFEDVTEQQAEQRRSDALADATALMAGSLDFDATLQVLARLAVPRLGDWCFVELLRDDGSIDRVAIEAADPEVGARAREYDRRYPLDPDSPVGSPKVIRSGEPDLQPEIPDAMLELAAQDDEHLAMLRGLGFRSWMIVPLRAGGRVIGDLALVSAESGRLFGAADLAAAQDLADRCGLYLDNARLYSELARARDELEAILAGVADAVTVQGQDGRLTYVNDAAVRLLGEPLGFDDRAALLAATPGELAAGFEMLGEDGNPLPLDRLPGRRALAGEVPEPVIVRYRVRATGESRWSRVKARPLRAPDGSVRAINVIEDITDLKQVEETQRLLAEAGSALAGSLDYEETLHKVARLAVPALADWCTVDVVGEHGLERVAVAHADPARADIAAQLRGVSIDPGGTVGPAAVLRTGRSELHRQVDEAHYRAAALNPAHRVAMLQIGARSNASVPMTVRGQRVGVMTLSTAESGRTLGPEQVVVLEELGRLAAVAVDSARVHHQRSAIARTLQESLLPPLLPEIPGIESAALYRAAGAGFDVGGDFYDLFSVSEQEWIAVIGDVCGKGAEAAAVTALARYTIRTAAVRRRSPAAIMRWLNDAMCRADLDGRFCTIACVHLDTSRTAGIRVTVACGGHPPVLLRRAGGEVEELGAAGTLLGLVRDPHLEDTYAELGAGDALVLYTDGITEARAPERVLGPEDLRAALSADPGEAAQAIVERLSALAMGKEGTPPRDDIAILALRAH